MDEIGAAIDARTRIHAASDLEHRHHVGPLGGSRGGRFPQPEGAKGSLRWMQRLVNQHSAALNDAIGLGPVVWRSPRADDAFAEYRDQAFVDRLGIALPKRPLKDFWPSGGPQWD